MSDEKHKVTDKAGEIARNIWLAGIGAYGKAVEDAQDRLGKAMEPPRLFRDLVKAGAALEEEAREAMGTTMESTAAARHSVEERINRVRENFHMQRPARMEDIVALQKQVEALSRKVDRLSRALAAVDKPAAAKKQTRGKKKAPGKKSTAAKKKAAGTNTAPRKTATKRKTATGRKG